MYKVYIYGLCTVVYCKDFRKCQKAMFKHVVFSVICENIESKQLKMQI